MPSANQLPIHRRITLEEFLAFTGWEVTPGMVRSSMVVALNYYQDKIPRLVLMRPVYRPGPALMRPLYQPSPWALPRGNVIKLSEFMQAIDYTKPVRRVIVGVNERLKSYRPRDEPKSRRPKGNWFTHLSADQRNMAIPGEQDLVRVYAVRRPVECLTSTVSDAFTWIHRSQEQIEHEPLIDKYYRGGGCQYFIWEPALYLELV